MVEEIEITGAGKAAARRDEAIQHGTDQRALRGGKHPGHHRLRAFRATWLATRSASAWIVDVGFTAPPVTMMLPSIT